MIDLEGVVRIAMLLVAVAPAAAAQQAPNIERGAAVYAEACASCHGANLEGRLDWQSRLPTGRMPAPPHDATGHTWHHGDGILFRLVKEGVAEVVGGTYESDMPAFAGVLSDDDIRAVLAFIKSTWPDRARAYQAQVSANESGN
ncbi:c-type cytochrome [Amaricoccus sp. W119]|jgi:mono/diheme cytochrome c family protein|uniref:c-type cytochrome n=1 Tax=Amaricoccus sp. W119 TaxID=3391833 RepID=UPI0039A62D04